MKKYRIITDSASDMAQNNSLGVTVLPMTIRFGDTEYQDGVNLKTIEFYEKLIENDELPTTSLISPGDFDSAFKSAVENGETVIAITMSGNLSGTFQSAALAAMEYPDKVFVVDSKSVAVGEHLLVMLASELIKKDLTPQEIIGILESEREKIHVLAVLDTLEYLKKGGRISSTVAFVGGALNIKPVVAVKDGKVEMIGKARGSKNGNNYLIKEIESTSGIDFTKPLCLGYTGLSDAMLNKYIEDSHHLWSGKDDKVTLTQIGPTIGTHVGPGAVAVAFVSK